MVFNLTAMLSRWVQLWPINMSYRHHERHCYAMCYRYGPRSWRVLDGRYCKKVPCCLPPCLTAIHAVGQMNVPNPGSLHLQWIHRDAWFMRSSLDMSWLG